MGGDRGHSWWFLKDPSPVGGDGPGLVSTRSSPTDIVVDVIEVTAREQVGSDQVLLQLTVILVMLEFFSLLNQEIFQGAFRGGNPR